MKNVKFSLAVTITVVMVALLLRLVVERLTGEPFPFVMNFFAVVFCTWFGGIRYGIFALVSAVILVNYVFHGPRLEFVFPDAAIGLETGIYVVLSLAGAWLMELQKRARRAAETATDLAREETKVREEAERKLIQAQTELKNYAMRLEDRVRERTAELEESIRFLERFLYSMAHEIRAPVRAIEGFCQVLREDYASKLDETAQDYCHRISTAAKRLDSLISDLLAYGTIAHQALPVRPVDLTKVVHEVARELDGSAHVTVRGTLPSVLAHPTAVRIALVNVLSNAMKFVPPGVTPQILVSNEDRENVSCLSICDNGIGIESDYVERIFEPFQRLHTQDVYHGSGIGLALVKLCMKRMGGDVGVISEPGKGSCFWLQFQKVTIPHPEQPRPEQMREEFPTLTPVL